RIEKYIVPQKASGGMMPDSRAWERLRIEGEDQSFMLPVSDTVPVFHIANNARTNAYGKSEIKFLIALQNAINHVLMSGMVATEFAAFSQKVIMGVQPENEEEQKHY